jgi:hypothetical protein
MAIPLTVFLWGRHESAEAEAARAERQRHDERRAEHEHSLEAARQNVGLVIRLLPDLNKAEDSKERRNALEVMKALEDQGELPPALRTALTKNVESIPVKPDGRATTAQGREEIELFGKNAPTSSDIAEGKASPQAIAIPGTKLYIQIFDEADRVRAEKVRAIARDLGIAVPGIENVTATSAKKNRPPPGGYSNPVLLVFKESDLANARSLADKVEKEAKLHLSVLNRSDRPAFNSVPAGQIEVWFASK